MNDIQDRSGSSSSRLFVGCLIFFIFTAPFLYVLSIGPVAWLFQAMGWPKRYAITFYTPVIWLHDHTFLKEPLEWYLKLFSVK